MTTAAEYHARTSYERHRMSGHAMDWDSRPELFKHYPGVERIPLPRDSGLPPALLSSVLRYDRGGPAGPPHPDIRDLSRILVLAYGLTATSRHGGEEFFFRSAASAGALYPTEIYVAGAGVSGLRDGLYHFSAAEHGLSRLREGCARGDATPALTFYLTAIFFRSAWKYRDRAYRYHLLDTGHVLENLTLALKAMGLPFVLSYDFDDRAINELLCVDPDREGVLAVCRVPDGPGDSGAAPHASAKMPEGFRAASRVSSGEVNYPAILDIHAAGARILLMQERSPDLIRELGIAPAVWRQIDPPGRRPETMTCAEAILRRRSSRNYIPEPLSGDSLRVLLEGMCTEDPGTPIGSTSIGRTLGIGLVVGHADDTEPGLYLVDSMTRSWGLAVAGAFAGPMAQVCLDQAWLRHASLHVLCMADLAALDRSRGARGYRHSMLNAGRLGQRLYVQATAMGLGCCGIGALYDGEAVGLLGLGPTSRLLYLVAVGVVKPRGARMKGGRQKV